MMNVTIRENSNHCWIWK